jgi:hypothetical protein
MPWVYVSIQLNQTGDISLAAKLYGSDAWRVIEETIYQQALTSAREGLSSRFTLIGKVIKPDTLLSLLAQLELVHYVVASKPESIGAGIFMGYVYNAKGKHGYVASDRGYFHSRLHPPKLLERIILDSVRR